MHNTQRDNFLPQRVTFLLLLLLLLQQKLYVIDGLLKHRSFGNLIARGIRMLTRWDQILKGVVTLLDGVPPLLLSLRMSLSPALLVAYSGIFVITIFIL